ncbi:MAG: hypothetical protein VYD64_11790 [Pseudomonadota bacterium]|nr:hypothetical protein [Pseudomonadota bacterium]
MAMDRRTLLDTAFVATICALLLLVAALAIALASDPVAGQEPFETVSDPSAYAAALAASGAGLRAVLFVDSLFLLAYTVAIGFTAMTFAVNNCAAAWVGGLGILAVMALDMLENATMVQSLDIATLTGAVSMERIAFQATISAMKWQLSAAALLAVSFVLPSATLVEKLLVWGVRLGLPVAVPLFVMNPLGLRETGGLLLLVVVAGGFVLLSLVLRSQARNA